MGVGNSIPYMGWQSALCIAKQATMTTFVTAGSFIEFNTESMKIEREEIKLSSINTLRDYTKRLIGNESIGGSIEADLNANNDGIINLIKNAMGGTVSSAAHVSSAAAYTHTLNLGDMESNAATSTATDMKGLSISVRKGSTNVWNFSFCRVNSLTLKGEVGGPVVLSAEIVGQSCTTGLTIGAAAISFNNDLPVNFTGVTIKTGVSIAAVLVNEYFNAFEFTLNNNIDTDQRRLGSRNIAVLPAGKRDVTLKLTQAFDTTTSYDRFTQNTMTAIEITLDSGYTMTGASVTSSIVIKLPNCRFNSTSPDVGDSGVLMYEVESTALLETTTSYVVQMVVNNGTASYQ